MLNPERQISVLGGTMSHPSLRYRLDLVFVTSYHPRLRFCCPDPTLVLDSISMFPVYLSAHLSVTLRFCW